MHRLFFLLYLWLVPLFLFSQTTSKDSSSKKSLSDYFNGANVVVGNSNTPPAYPGGKKGWDAFLKDHINIATPLINKAPSGTYNVIIRYTVNQDGSLFNIGAISGCGYGMEDEVIKCLKQSPKWQPALNSKNETVSFATKQIVTYIIKGTSVTVLIK